MAAPYSNFLWTDSLNHGTFRQLLVVMDDYLPGTISERLGLPKELEAIKAPQWNPEHKKEERELLALQKFFDRKKLEIMRMFGSPEELLTQLKLFRTDAYPNYDNPCELFSTLPWFHPGLIDKEWIRKKNAFIYLQNIVFDCFESSDSDLLRRMCVAAFLKFHQAAVANCMEFVRCNDEILVSIRQELADTLIELRQQIFANTRSPAEYNIDTIFETIRKFIPGGWDDEKHRPIRKYLTVLRDIVSQGDKSNCAACRELTLDLETTFRTLHQVMTNRPQIFMPSRVNDGSPKFLRLFEDGQRKFVLEEELNKALGNELNGASNHNDLLKTINYDQAKEKIIQRMNIRLIPTMIIRAKHAAQWIPLADGTFAKLAVDILFELLTELFQPSEFHLIEGFLNKGVETMFLPEEPERLLLRIQREKRPEWKMGQILKRQAKNIRAIGSTFTAKTLKDELVYLDLTNLFPDIVNYADRVYRRLHLDRAVCSEKRKLRTCDMFDAVEQCILACLLRRVPELAIFIHNQSACHRFWMADCCDRNALMFTEPRVQFVNTECIWFGLDDVQVGPMPSLLEFPPLTPLLSNEMIMDQIRLKDSNFDIPHDLLYSSTMMYVYLHEKYRDNTDVDKKQLDLLISKSRQMTHTRKVFLISRHEFHYCLEDISRFPVPLNAHEALGWAEKFESLTKYTNPELLSFKAPYLRYFSPSAVDMDKNWRVFAEEVLEMIPILVRRVNYEKLETYTARYASTDGLPMTMTMEELREVLLDFDIDKSAIIMVPDIYYAKCVKKLMMRSGCPVVSLLAPNHELITFTRHAVFGIFQRVVCDVDWSVEVEGSRQSTKDFRKRILDEMERVLKNSTDFIRTSSVNLLKEPNYAIREEKKMLTPAINLFDCQYGDTITIAYFLEQCEEFQLMFRRPPGISEQTLSTYQISAWRARLMFFIAWIDKFFGNDHRELRAIVEEELFLKLPFKKWKKGDDLLHFLATDACETEDIKDKMMRAQVDDDNGTYSTTHDIELVVDDMAHPWLEATSYQDRTFITRGWQWKGVAPRKNSAAFIAYGEKEKLSVQILSQIVEFSRKNPVPRKPESVQPNSLWRIWEAVENLGRMMLESKSKPELKNELASEPVNLPTPSSESSTMPVDKPSLEEILENRVSGNCPVLIYMGEQIVNDKPSSESPTSPVKVQKKKKKKAKSQKTVTEAETEAPPPIEPGTHCTKCLRTSEICQEAKRDLRKIEKELKELREDQGKKSKKDLEKELKESRTEHQQVEETWVKKEHAMKEEMEKMRLRMVELEASEASLKGEKERSRVELRAKNQENQDLRQQLAGSTNLPLAQGNLTLEMRKELVSLQDQMDVIRSNRLQEEVRNKVDKLKRLMPTNTAIERLCRRELNVFTERFTLYEQSVQRNIEAIQHHLPLVQFPLALTDAPVLSRKFEEEYTKADEENEARGRQCVVCSGEKLPEDLLFRCPHCPNTFHSACALKWKRYKPQPTCPLCAREW